MLYKSFDGKLISNPEQAGFKDMFFEIVKDGVQLGEDFVLGNGPSMDWGFGGGQGVASATWDLLGSGALIVWDTLSTPYDFGYDLGPNAYNAFQQMPTIKSSFYYGAENVTTIYLKQNAHDILQAEMFPIKRNLDCILNATRTLTEDTILMIVNTDIAFAETLPMTMNSNITPYIENNLSALRLNEPGRMQQFLEITSNLKDIVDYTGKIVAGKTSGIYGPSIQVPSFLIDENNRGSIIIIVDGREA